MRLLIASCVALCLLAQPAGARTCQEDNACWNWRTMGNHHRSITTNGGRTLIVRAKRFDRANAGFFIDWSRTRKLHGDGHRFDAQDY